MSDFVDAVAECHEQLHRNDYEPTGGLVYVHPLELHKARDELDHVQPFTEGMLVYGVTIETTVNIPKGLVLLIHKDAAILGPESIAFATID